MLEAYAAIIAGLAVLVWSADRFVLGSAAASHRLGMPPLLIGLVVVGFGTSAPELVVSASAAMQGSSGIALGNAYGSNITNIALILGITALISPITVSSQVLRKELPILTAVSGLAAWQVADGAISRNDSLALLGVFAALLVWAVREGMKQRADALGNEVEGELHQRGLPLGKAVFWVAAGLILLVASSRMLVWGAVEVARAYGIDDLVIGLTVVAVGTSLPELASSVAAARRRESDIALGNVLGSNLFNTLAVVGLAGLIEPIAAGPEVLRRDILVMGVLTVSLFAIGYGLRGPGRVNRIEGALLLLCYAGYTAYLIGGAFGR